MSIPNSLCSERLTLLPTLIFFWALLTIQFHSHLDFFWALLAFDDMENIFPGFRHLLPSTSWSWYSARSKMHHPLPILHALKCTFILTPCLTNSPAYDNHQVRRSTHLHKIFQWAIQTAHRNHLVQLHSHPKYLNFGYSRVPLAPRSITSTYFRNGPHEIIFYPTAKCFSLCIIYILTINEDTFSTSSSSSWKFPAWQFILSWRSSKLVKFSSSVSISTAYLTLAFSFSVNTAPCTPYLLSELHATHQLFHGSCHNEDKFQVFLPYPSKPSCFATWHKPRTFSLCLRCTSTVSPTI